MSKGIELKPQDVEELKSVITSISTILKQHSKLDEHLGLSDRFLGPLGEAMGIVKIVGDKKVPCL
jgi:hypothetical protein